MDLQSLRYLETRTRFVSELIMPVKSCPWILLLKALGKTPEYNFLNLGASVFRLAGGVKASDVADADGVGVVAGAVCSDHLEGTALFNGAVESDDEVVAYHFEASLPVPAVYVSDCEVLTFLGG